MGWLMNYSLWTLSDDHKYSEHYLVGGLEHEFYFSIYWEFHNPLTDFHSMIFQRGRSTTKQIIII